MFGSVQPNLQVNQSKKIKSYIWTYELCLMQMNIFICILLTLRYKLYKKNGQIKIKYKLILFNKIEIKSYFIKE